MKKRKRAIIVIALTAAILLSLVPGAFVSANDDVQTLSGSAFTSQTVLESGHYKIASDVIYPAGIKIADGATVYIDIPEGLTLSCLGLDARYEQIANLWIYTYNYRVLSTPGIEVGEGATLHITGEGSLNVKGGDGLHAMDGGTSEDIFTFVWSLYPLTGADSEKMQILGGPAGIGGQGAMAPSPAIGGAAGAPGDSTGFAGGFADMYKPPMEELGKSYNGNNGGNGSAMGTVYIEGSVSVTAAAGAGDYDVPGKGGTAEGAKFTEYGFSGYTKLYGMLTKGAPGGGGSSANASAIIGGGGGAGGSGGGGLSGGAKVVGGTTTRTFDYTTTFTNGYAGTETAGGSGGMSYQPKISGYETRKAGVGGVKGSNGEGGTLYIAETASVNGISGTDLSRTDLGGATADGQQGQGAEVRLLTRAEVSADLDGEPYSGLKVFLQSSKLGKLDLAEMEGVPGTYFAYIPTGSENLKLYTNSEFTSYSLSAPDTAAVIQNLRFHACEIDLSLDGGTYGETGDHKITLMKGNTLTNTFTEETGGVFKANICLNKDGEDTYDIYVDGVPYEKTLTVAEGATVDAPFYTLTANVRLNSSGDLASYEDRMVTLSKGTRFAARMEESPAGVYKAIVPGEDSSGAISYTIAIDDDISANLLTAETGAEATIDYYNIAISLMDSDSPRTGALVNIMGDGKLKNAAEVMSKGKGTGIYKVILFGEDGTEYTIVADGAATKGRIQVTDPEKRDRTVNFFTAKIALMKDGKNWKDGASVILKQDGESVYVLPYNETTTTYTSGGVEAGTYDIYVYGAGSPAGTGEEISSGDVKTIQYYTITYHKNIEGSSSGDKVQIYQKDTVPGTASAPYEPGYTFISWKTGPDADAQDYVPQAVTAPEDLYAAWVRPQVSLGELVRCTEEGLVAQTGGYLKFANLAIQGYPLESPVIGTITISLENVKLTTADLPEGWSNEGKWDPVSGNGKYVLQADPSAKMTVAGAQEYLRGLIFVRNSSDGVCSVQMSVYGNTTVE